MALNIASEGASVRGGKRSRMMAMPMGMSAIPSPCIPRPIRRIGSNGAVTATIAPTIVKLTVMISMRFLPYMSAMRVMIGTLTHPVSSVSVTNHETSLREAPRISVKCGRRGMTSVCWIAIRRPPSKSTARIAQRGRVVVSGIIAPGVSPSNWLWETRDSLKRRLRRTSFDRIARMRRA